MADEPALQSPFSGFGVSSVQSDLLTPRRLSRRRKIDPKEGLMQEVVRSAVVMVMGVVVMGAGIAVMFYG
jgi:hypothetical protein